MSTLSVFAAVAVLSFPVSLVAQTIERPPTRAPARIELRDQFDAPQSLTFPTTNITVLLIADRQGSEQVNQWVTVLKRKCADPVSIRGLALVTGVPKFLRARVCAEFRAKRKYPVMMDWSGKVCEQLGYRSGVANVLIIEPDGLIRARFEGSATEPRAGEAMKMLDNLREKSAPAGREHAPPLAN